MAPKPGIRTIPEMAYFKNQFTLFLSSNYARLSVFGIN